MLNIIISALALSSTLCLAAPTFTPRQNVQVINNCYNNGQVALTWDDGPGGKEYDVANALKNYNQKGTFFFNGNNYGCIYDRAQILKDISAQGHTIGSHGWSHKDFTKLQEWEMHQELEKVETAFIKILGLKPIYFRPPYGAYNQQVLNVLGQRGYKKVFIWSDDTKDASGASIDSQRGVLNNVASQYPRPKMVLMHSTSNNAGEEAWHATWAMSNAGYKAVAVDTCLGGAGEWPYQYVGQPQQRDGSWRC